MRLSRSATMMQQARPSSELNDESSARRHARQHTATWVGWAVVHPPSMSSLGWGKGADATQQSAVQVYMCRAAHIMHDGLPNGLPPHSTAM